MAYVAWSVVFGEQPSAAKWNQLGTNDAGFKDGTNIDASAITPEKLLTGAGTSWAYQAYAAAFTNVTIGSGTRVAQYCKVGRMVHYWGNFTYGAGSAVSGAIGIPTPTTMDSSFVIAGENNEVGWAHIQDTGAQAFGCMLRADSTTVLTLVLSNTSGTYIAGTSTSSTVPMVWGTGDKFFWNVTYPSAA